MKLDIPFFKQDTDYTCGPAALQMAFLFLGTFTSEKKLAKVARTNSEIGTTHRGMIDTALKQKFYCYVNKNSTINEIRHFVRLSFPVIIDYTEPSSDTGHYAIISGYQDRHVILNDPWNGEGFKLSEAEFVSRWYDNHDGNNPCASWMMALSKEPFNLGKQYSPDLSSL
jgi:predicted double-glycine peptidase